MDTEKRIRSGPWLSAKSGNKSNHSSMLGKYQTDRWASARVVTNIVCSVQTVFTFVCDPTNDPLWMPNLGPGLQSTAEHSIGVGTRFRQSVRFFYGSSDVEWEIIELIPNRRVSAGSVAGPIAFDGGYEFAPMGTSTLLTKFGSVRLSGVLSLMPAYIAGTLLKADFEKATKHLKWLLERQAKGGDRRCGTRDGQEN
jgi:hypothetical protein